LFKGTQMLQWYGGYRFNPVSNTDIVGTAYMFPQVDSSYCCSTYESAPSRISYEVLWRLFFI